MIFTKTTYDHSSLHTLYEYFHSRRHTRLYSDRHAIETGSLHNGTGGNGTRRNMVLKVVRPLYGIPESGLHWYLTYIDRHTERLGIIRATIDTCILFKR